jgi:hypothetical protein
MRKTVRLLAATALAAACFAGAEASSASAADGLTVSCTFNACSASGQLGTLSGAGVLTPSGGFGIICVANNQGPCSEANALLVFQPNGIFGSGRLGTASGGVLITPSFSFGALGFDNGPVLELTASNGAIGTAVLSPGFRKCVVIQGLTITTPPC